MVNYCCVQGCSRNSRTSKHLYFYTIPKEKIRQEQWLKAVAREDLLDKSQEKRTTHRVCSRHFTPSSVKNKHLCADAVPSLCLPGLDITVSSDDSDVEKPMHEYVSCDGCNEPIRGFRYKCLTCEDYDLCSKCEMQETHTEHYMLRIPKPTKFKIADDMIKKLQHASQDKLSFNDTSDDEPIIKHVRNYDSGIDLSEDVKNQIKDEVTRIMSIDFKELEKKKKQEALKKRINTTDLEKESKRRKNTEVLSVPPEVAFADVNQIENILSVKNETQTAINSVSEVHTSDGTNMPILYMKLSEDLSELMVDMNNQKLQVYKFDG